MGNLFQTLVDLDATPAEAAVLASRALDWLVREAIVSAELQCQPEDEPHMRLDDHAP